MPQTYPINIWINDERYEKLQEAGLTGMTREVLAGMKVIKLQCTVQQKDELLHRYPTAKFDTATTKSIELLPPTVKDELFELLIEKQDVDVVGDFLREAGEG